MSQLDAHIFFLFFFAFQFQKLSLPPFPFLGYFQKFVPPHFSQCSYATENILFPIHSKYMLAQEKLDTTLKALSWNPHIPESLKIFVLRFVQPQSPFPHHTRLSAIIESFFLDLESLRNLQKQTQSIFWNVSAVYNFEFVKEWIQDFVYRYRPKNPFLFMFHIFPLVVLPI